MRKSRSWMRLQLPHGCSARLCRGTDTHYYAIAEKASLSKPIELSPAETKLNEFASKFGISWQQALAQGLVYNAVDACDVLSVDVETMDAQWAVAKASNDLLKFGGGFYVAMMPKRAIGTVVRSAGDILSEIPKSLYGGLDALALPSGNRGCKSSNLRSVPAPSPCRSPRRPCLWLHGLAVDDSEKMLLFPETVIKSAVDTLKEVAIDDFKSEQYERAVKHLTVALCNSQRARVSACAPSATLMLPLLPRSSR